MSNPIDANDEPATTNNEVVDLNTGADEALDWNAAIAELNEAESRLPAPPPPPLPPPTPTATAPREHLYAPRPRREPRIREGLAPAEELSEVLMAVNSAMNQLRKFESKHKALIAPNIFRVWEDGLRETATGVTREFGRLREQESGNQTQTAGDE